MDRAEYVDRYKQIEAEAEKAIVQLQREWVNTTKLFDVGEKLTSKCHSIIVTDVLRRNPSHSFKSQPPQVVYKGKLLTKAGALRKDGSSVCILQSDVTHVNGKPVTQSGG